MVAAPSGAAVLAVVFTLVGVAFVILVARIYLRLVIQKQKLIAADWLRILAWLSALATASSDIVYAVEGSLDPANNYTLVNWDVPPEKMERVLRFTWASMIPFFTTFYLCKASLIVVYFQLFPPFMKKRRMALWAVSVYCVCAFIASMCLQLFLCFPITRNWEVKEPEKACSDWSLITTFQTAWALHFIGSLALFLLPFLILHKLNMRPQVKISVYAIFLLGFIDIAFSLTRFLNIQLTVVGDFRSITAVELWSALDVYIGLIIAFLPALRPYLRRKGAKYSYADSGRPTGNSTHPARRTVDRGFTEIDETPSLEGDPRPGPWAVSHSPELGATGWNDKKSNSSDVELVSLDVTAAKDRDHV
ncbi:uncharacterized protein B0J16DRAFT_379006 [Fusarium flagelliforme]|uniref:Rhodopsin domain-containing protein n=1 Tax=Fusarium flagelliforme TaxID=2675880 RepID=A0A395MRQ6_9HYPO|nr:uncharacterized protein B0J16DRAFT_379006 [Fusarium flagelliforme]KAH7198560.1 hypothetical protein B0J16DRAFT_379006 [Fusarium flagelliforme]RFN50644.1 hypothetical protein FIE12Z_5089 [Fusarium flagelliforme]